MKSIECMVCEACSKFEFCVYGRKGGKRKREGGRVTVGRWEIGREGTFAGTQAD